MVWPSVKYEKEAFRQLRDRQTFEKLSKIPLYTFSHELHLILYTAFESGSIQKSVFDALVVKYPKIPTLLCLG